MMPKVTLESYCKLLPCNELGYVLMHEIIYNTCILQNNTGLLMGNEKKSEMMLHFQGRMFN